MVEAYVALGSNLADPIFQIEQAILKIDALEKTKVKVRSSLYQTPPWGNVSQPDFINAVLKIETEFSAHELLNHLHKIEDQQGRQRTVHWGPRTIDCDLILYDQKIIEDETLILPHPRMNSRGFVLLPLVEIAPNLALPTGEKIVDLLIKCDCTGIQKL